MAALGGSLSSSGGFDPLASLAASLDVPRACSLCSTVAAPSVGCDICTTCCICVASVQSSSCLCPQHGAAIAAFRLIREPSHPRYSEVLTCLARLGERARGHVRQTVGARVVPGSDLVDASSQHRAGSTARTAVVSNPPGRFPTSEDERASLQARDVSELVKVIRESYKEKDAPSVAVVRTFAAALADEPELTAGPLLAIVKCTLTFFAQN